MEIQCRVYFGVDPRNDATPKSAILRAALKQFNIKRLAPVHFATVLNNSNSSSWNPKRYLALVLFSVENSGRQYEVVVCACPLAYKETILDAVLDAIQQAIALRRVSAVTSIRGALSSLSIEEPPQTTTNIALSFSSSRGKAYLASFSYAVHVTSTLRRSGSQVPQLRIPADSTTKATLAFDLCTPTFPTHGYLWVYLMRDDESDDHLHGVDMVVAMAVLPIHSMRKQGRGKAAFHHVVSRNSVDVGVSWDLPEEHRLQEADNSSEHAEEDKRLGEVRRLFSVYDRAVAEVERELRSACRFPSGSLASPRTVVRSVYHPLCTLPIVFFFLQAIMPTVVELYPSGCDAFVENLILVACHCLQMSVAEYSALPAGHTRREFIAKTVCVLGSVLSYTADSQGEYFSEPYHSPSLRRAQADCEDLSILNLRIVAMIRNTTSKRCAPLREWLADYIGVACLITSKGTGKPGDEDGPSADSYHQVAILMPRTQLAELTKPPKERRYSDEGDSSLQPILLESMANVQCTALPEKVERTIASELFTSVLRPYLTLADMQNAGIYKDLYRAYVCDSKESNSGGLGLSGEYLPLTRRGTAYGVSFVDFLNDPLGLDLEWRLAVQIDPDVLRDVSRVVYDETRYLNSLIFKQEHCTLSDRDIQADAEKGAGEKRKRLPHLHLVGTGALDRYSKAVRGSAALAKTHHGTGADFVEESEKRVYICEGVVCNQFIRQDYSKRPLEATTQKPRQRQRQK